MHYLKGNIFESYVISELLKSKFNSGSSKELFYWKDLNGNEIDCIISSGTEIKAIEIKSSSTIKSDFFKTLYLWNKLNPKKNNNLNLIFGGNEVQKRESIKIVGWNDCSDVF